MSDDQIQNNVKEQKISDIAASCNGDKRSQFGNRHLVDEAKVFDHNAWDDVEWSTELEEEAQKKIDQNSIVTLTQKEQEIYEQDAGKFWDTFYCQHQNKFFKDRHWLFTEFPELTVDQPSSQCEGTTVKDLQKDAKIFEVGCGVGNTVFPLLQTNTNSSLFIYCCDIADSAIEIVKEHALYDESRCHAFTCNIATDEEPEFPFPPSSIDFITLIFVLSAIHPDRIQLVLNRLAKVLKPGGMLLFRDYGRHDMVQLRFKPGRCLSNNFYVRGDGTRVYFFTQEEIDSFLTNAGLVKVQNIIDRRLQINRGRQLKMYRIWIQCKYMKPVKAGM